MEIRGLSLTQPYATLVVIQAETFRKDEFPINYQIWYNASVEANGSRAFSVNRAVVSQVHNILVGSIPPSSRINVRSVGLDNHGKTARGYFAMKNGRALKGHRRIVEPVGTPSPAVHRSPSGGWQLSCICGWDGGNWPNNSGARAAYRKHIDYYIDQCHFRCKRCGMEKPLSEMRADYRYICRPCYSDLGNDWQRRHPIESARHKRNHHLLKKFGVTVDEVDDLLKKQGGVCGICGELITDTRGYGPHVDHDHVTGRVRGVLCFHCNAGLGQFGDNVDVLRCATKYLEHHKESVE